MLPHLLVILPFLFAVLIFSCGKRYFAARFLLVTCSVLYFSLTFYIFFAVRFNLPGLTPTATSYIAFIPGDTIQSTVLVITAIIFLATSVYSFCILPIKRVQKSQIENETLMPKNIFLGILAAFVGSMTVVALARNFGLLWVAMEATTLLSAPLIILRRNAGSIEAMWKYMLICSVGIGLALFGTMLMAHSSQLAGIVVTGLDFSSFQDTRESLNPIWFKTAFIFILAGYGTKMGLAPFHTWLPDAYSEAPSSVSSLLSGTLVNCSFLAIARFRQIAPSAVAPFCDRLMLALGLFSIAVAAVFIVGQRDFKRMLSYSSVEHMGLILIFFALSSEYLHMHMLFHSMIKAALFMIAGNVLMMYGTRSVASVRGMLQRSPLLSILWIAGILLICGTPPSPLFITELFLILKSGLQLGGIILILLFAVFCAMTYIMISMTMGKSDDLVPEPKPVSHVLNAVPLALIVAVILLGISASLITSLPNQF
ncbi:MAG: hydrogenase [Lentisphaerae bacterium]|nr:hydrogenase [Lentisphaerota bacterium]